MSANTPKLQVVPKEAEAEITKSTSVRTKIEDKKEKKSQDSYSEEQIQAFREKYRFMCQFVPTIHEKTDAELLECLKRFDGGSLNGKLVGDRYSNSPTPMVISRPSDGRLIYHDPSNPEHHGQLLIVRLIELINGNRRNIRNLFENLGRSL